MNAISNIKASRPHERALVRTWLFSIEAKRKSGSTFDLPKLIETLSNEYSGNERAALQQVSELLASDVSIVDALEQTPAALNSSAVMALRLASQTGTTEETLRGLIANSDALDGANEVSPSNFGYGQPSGGFAQSGSYLFAAWFLVSFLMMFIVPTIEVMFEEFGIVLPATMKLLIVLSRYVSNYFWLLLLFMVFLYLIERRLKGKRMWRRGMQASLAQQSTHVLNLLAMVVRQGRPLSAGLATLANYHPTAPIRSRLAKASLMIEHGMPPWDALAEHGFLASSEATALSRLEPPKDLFPVSEAGGDTASCELHSNQIDHTRGTQAWMLRWIASHRQRRIWIRNGIGLRLISISALLVIAFVVSLAAIAMFQSVYSIVEALA